MFAKGSGSNNDPVRGYVFVFLVSLVCILIGDLNIVSSLLSNFFVASYALINFSSFHARYWSDRNIFYMIAVVNWFQYHEESWLATLLQVFQPLALSGRHLPLSLGHVPHGLGLLSAVEISPDYFAQMTAILTFVIICVLYFWIHYRKPEANWGSSTQVLSTLLPHHNTLL